MSAFRWDAAALLAAHTPRFRHPYKQLLFDVAMLGPPPTGTLGVSRWPRQPLPRDIEGDVVLAEAPGFYTYDEPEPGTIDWHQNFADPEVFGFYGGGLYAQDEMQVAEHPLLASVREALVAAGEGRTLDEMGTTPILVTGVERRVTVDTEPSLNAGREAGLYGNRFAAASLPVLKSAIRRIVPPSISNIVAIAAPRPGAGAYDSSAITSALLTAYSGYHAVIWESHRLVPDAKVVVHTGFWGCGAFGGNRALMVAVQAMAARLAGVHTLVFHVGSVSGHHDAAEGRRILATAPTQGPVAGWIDALVGMRLPWGVSDGN